jgi:V-type H+-transporting ATPase subunit E
MADTSIQNMISFIQNEAKEKATEIEMEGNEAYTIEKQRIIDQEKKKIKADFERKKKTNELERKVAESNLKKVARLRVLKAREDIMDQVKSETVQLLVQHTKDATKYKQTMTALIAQGASELQLNDKATFEVRSLQRDSNLVKEILQDATAAYLKNTKKNGTFKASTTVLDEKEIGGVQVTSSDGKVRCNNTLKGRVEKVMEDLLPVVRNNLFGKTIHKAPSASSHKH